MQNSDLCLHTIYTRIDTDFVAIVKCDFINSHHHDAGDY
jgi:hypothetical protein